MAEKIGTAAWADAAERSEWSFMAKMLAEAIEHIKPVNLSGLGVAKDIAEARAKEGWRAFVPVPEEKPKTALSPQKRAVLLEMAQHNPEAGVPGFHTIACNLAIDETSAKRAIRALARTGLAKRVPLFDTDDGRIMGSGYVLTDAGQAHAVEIGGDA